MCSHIAYMYICCISISVSSHFIQSNIKISSNSIIYSSIWYIINHSSLFVSAHSFSPFFHFTLGVISGDDDDDRQLSKIEHKPCFFSFDQSSFFLWNKFKPPSFPPLSFPLWNVLCWFIIVEMVHVDLTLSQSIHIDRIFSVHHLTYSSPAPSLPIYPVSTYMPYIYILLPFFPSFLPSFFSSFFNSFIP